MANYYISYLPRISTLQILEKQELFDCLTSLNYDEKEGLL